VAYISDQDKAYLAEQFSELSRPVTLRLFVRQGNCPTCGIEEELLRELVSTSVCRYCGERIPALMTWSAPSDTQRTPRASSA